MKLTSGAVQNGIFTNHGVCMCNYRDLRYKLEHKLPCSIHVYPPHTVKLGCYIIQFRLKSKKSFQKYSRVLAKINGDDAESNSWRICEGIFNDAAMHGFESNFSSEVTSVSSSISGAKLEEDTECQSVPKEELSCYPSDYQVYQVHADKLKAVLMHVLASGRWNASRLKLCHRNYLVSATNLIHYLALRSLDVQQLNEELSCIGLSSLQGADPHVLSSIASSIQLLDKQAPNAASISSMEIDNAMEFSISSMRMKAFARATTLLGMVHNKKGVHIMVTVGKEAIANEMFLGDLLKAGAEIVRINCAHDDCSIWSEIIRRAKHSSQKLEKPCRILMDLAGPKLRTGLLNKGPNVMKIHPKKDARGDVIVPALVWLSVRGCAPPSHVSPATVLHVEDKKFLDELEVGSIIRFIDVRGRKRLLRVSKRFSVFAGYGYLLECSRSAYVESGTKLRIERKKGKDIIGYVVDVPAAEHFVSLTVGDLLTICKPEPSSPCCSSFGAHKITCDSGRLFDCVKPGEPIAFDDGKIWGVIQGASNCEIVVSITHASPKGSKLGSGKSINIPESAVQFEGLTSKDLQDLDFVAGNADMVGISFIRNTLDVKTVMQELAKRKLHDLGVVLKIETRDAVEKLPLLLLEAMQYPNPLGVMIARGDLAVECGWDQMASIQEEILSVCSAAHIPVIWATQVLDSLVKSGIPTRAEITDVATGMRANCIMLNKGKHIVEAVSSLASILQNHPMETIMNPLLPSS